MELDLRNLILIIRRWWWLLLLIPISCSSAAFITSSRQDELYQASAMVKINSSQADNNTTTNAFLATSLTSTYQTVATSRAVLEPAAEQLGAPYSADYLLDVVTAAGVRDTQLLRIAASDTDPALAARIANEVAAQLAIFVERTTQNQITKAEGVVDQLIGDTEAAAAETRAEIDALRSSGDTGPDTTARLNDLQDQLDSQESALNDYRQQKASLSYNAELSRTSIEQWIAATPPSNPYAPRVLFYAVLGLFIGGLVALGVVVLLEYFDNTVKADSDFPNLVGAPMLSVVGLAPKALDRGREQLFVLNNSNSTMAESVRLLRTNIEFAAATKEISSLAVTSATPGEGKSTITANLGIAMAQSGFSVAVIDADLRRPSQHKAFDVSNSKGLTTLLTRPGGDWREQAVEVIRDLWLIPSGPLPPNPADLLSSDRMKELLAELGKTVDIVLVDTPPVLVVSDPVVVATNVDAVFLVSRAGRTRTDQLRRAGEVLRQGNVRMLGVVVNQQTGRDGSGYYYYYDAEYYSEPPPQNGQEKAVPIQEKTPPKPEPKQSVGKAKS